MKHLESLQYSRSQSDSTHHRRQSISPYHANDADNGARRSVQLVQQREEEYAVHVMQQREEEMRDIHRKMSVVNEIYKDLGQVVDQQQEQIDRVEDKFGGAADATRRGLELLEKANSKHEKVAAADNDDDRNDIGGAAEKRKQFILFQYLSKSVTKSANEVVKLISVCGGSGSADYVDKSSWKK